MIDKLNKLGFKLDIDNEALLIEDDFVQNHLPSHIYDVYKELDKGYRYQPNKVIDYINIRMFCLRDDQLIYNWYFHEKLCAFPRGSSWITERYEPRITIISLIILNKLIENNIKFKIHFPKSLRQTDTGKIIHECYYKICNINTIKAMKSSIDYKLIFKQDLAPIYRKVLVYLFNNKENRDYFYNYYDVQIPTRNNSIYTSFSKTHLLFGFNRPDIDILNIKFLMQDSLVDGGITLDLKTDYDIFYDDEELNNKEKINSYFQELYDDFKIRMKSNFYTAYNPIDSSFLSKYAFNINNSSLHLLLNKEDYRNFLLSFKFINRHEKSLENISYFDYKFKETICRIIIYIMEYQRENKNTILLNRIEKFLANDAFEKYLHFKHFKEKLGWQNEESERRIIEYNAIDKLESL